MLLHFDIEDPPAQPPAGSDRLLWVTAYELWCDHQPHIDGYCLSRRCQARGVMWPCDMWHLARAAMVAASLDGLPGAGTLRGDASPPSAPAAACISATTASP